MNEPDFRVFLIDDDPGVLKGLTRLLTAAGHQVSAFLSSEAFLAELDPALPGCVVCDLAMPGLNGLQLQAALAERDIELPIIFVTGAGDIPTSVRAMKAGAVDFLTKPVNDADLLGAIGRAAEKDREASRLRGERASITARLARLTRREREVFARVIAGTLNKQIAADLGTVEKTVKVHRGRMMAKMGVRSVADLVRLAEHAGIRPETG